ncbi:dienelactone hydrolase family protein [Brachybacterium sp. UNK5269]|uniref:dienelactone hydrolase family protein n=1 Tax=Brachybacterium sp. UNK5269 TaxID=3408576 RepID=UPI003BB06BFD
MSDERTVGPGDDRTSGPGIEWTAGPGAALTDTASPAQRRRRLRALLGLPAALAEQAATLDRLPPADAQPAEVLLRTAEGEQIPAFLLRPAPEAATGAGVVLIAGHGRGIDDLVRTDPTDEYHDGLAHKLVAAGVTVLCPEMISFGRRRVPRPAGAAPYQPGESSCTIDAARHLLRGRPVLGRRVADARAAVTALRQVPGVEAQRVAVAGGSGGGAVSLLLAAVDTSIAAALVATYFCTFEASLCAISHCPCNIVPGLLPDLEMAGIAALVAPRPLLLEAGERDPIFPIEATRAAFAQLGPAWEEQGGAPPELVVTDGAHAFRAEASLDALLQRLS